MRPFEHIHDEQLKLWVLAIFMQGMGTTADPPSYSDMRNNLNATYRGPTMAHDLIHLVHEESALRWACDDE